MHLVYHRWGAVSSTARRLEVKGRGTKEPPRRRFSGAYRGDAVDLPHLRERSFFFFFEWGRGLEDVMGKGVPGVGGVPLVPPIWAETTTTRWFLALPAIENERPRLLVGTQTSKSPGRLPRGFGPAVF